MDFRRFSIAMLIYHGFTAIKMLDYHDLPCIYHRFTMHLPCIYHGFSYENAGCSMGFSHVSPAGLSGPRLSPASKSTGESLTAKCGEETLTEAQPSRPRSGRPFRWKVWKTSICGPIWPHGEWMVHGEEFERWNMVNNSINISGIYEQYSWIL